MDFAWQNRNRRGQFEAGPSTFHHGRNRNDSYLKQSRDNSGAGSSKMNNPPKRWYAKDDKGGRQSKGNYSQISRSNSVSSECSSLRLSESIKYNRYVCPMCKYPYTYFLSNNALSGKVPRILPCKHTVCEECIKKCLNTTNHVQCVICSKTEFDKKQLYECNHYVLGHLTYSKFNKSNIDITNIALVATESRTRLSLTSDHLVTIDYKEKCGFKDCSNPGTVSCVNCCCIYCNKCDDDVHNSGKELMPHKRILLNKATFELNKCLDHSMFQEIYCKDCDETSCCYCVLEKHEGHSRTFLARLSAEEENELVKAYDMAKLKRKHLLISQKKLSECEETEMESDFEIEIAQKFADIHAKLYLIEKKLYQEAKLLKNGHSNLMELNVTIKSDIERLNYIINCVDERENTKFNLRMLLDKLKEIKNLPAVLVSSESSTTPTLTIDEQIEDLEGFFKIDIPDKVTFSLMDVEEPPAEYNVEIELPIVNPSKNKSSSDSDCKNVRSQQNSGMRDMDRFKHQQVFVMHISSLDSFYVQFKEEDHMYRQLQSEIDSHSNRMKIGVNNVELKELYLAKRVCDKNRWCRVRVLAEILEQITYRVKFIDFGNTAVVSKDEMIYISASLAKKMPFAYECRLYNPSAFQWPKDTHLELAKLLDINKELVMYTREYSNNIYTVELNINTSAGGLCSVTDLLIFGCDALKKKPITENTIYDNSDVHVVGSSYDVFIRYILDPWHVYVQRTSSESTFNSLMKNMKEFYAESQCDIHLPVKNSYVVVFYGIKEIGNWHRAKILNVFENKKIVSVYLVDFGKCVRVPWKDTRKLSQLFKKSESLVVSVKLADIAPLTDDSWSDADEFGVVRYMERCCKKSQKKKILVSNDDPIEVVLFEPLETFDVNINALLVEKELARSTGKLSGTKMWIHKEEEDEKEENNILFIKDDTDDEEIENAIQGIKMQVEIIQFDDPSSFYVSFVSHKKNAEKLHEELQIHFKTMKNYRTDRNWQIKEKVVVFDSSDKMYYRGIITSIENNKFCVCLLDKPDYLWVDSGKLRCITSYFADNFPNTVFKCHLANIKAAGDSNKWSKLSVEWFQMLFKKREELFLKKIGDDHYKSSMPVTMWYSKIIQGTALEPSYRNYVSIDKKVVKAGLAFWVNNEIPQNQLPVINKPTTSKQADCDSNCEDSDCKFSDVTTDSSETVVENLCAEIKSVNITEWLPAPKFKTNVFNAYITCAENEGHLYVRDELTQKVYEEMEKKITQHLQTIPKTKNFILRENQMVMVESEGRWYRGLVLTVIDKNTARIIMVDFGSDHVVKLTDLHNQIMYPDLPILVSKIKLFDIQSKNGSWVEEEVEILINIAPQRAKIIIQSSLYNSVPLADVFYMDGICLNDKLVELCPNLSRSKSKFPKINREITQIEQQHELKNPRLTHKNTAQMILDSSLEKGSEPKSPKINIVNQIEQQHEHKSPRVPPEYTVQVALNSSLEKAGEEKTEIENKPVAGPYPEPKIIEVTEKSIIIQFTNENAEKKTNKCEKEETDEGKKEETDEGKKEETNEDEKEETNEGVKEKTIEGEKEETNENAAEETNKDADENAKELIEDAEEQTYEDAKEELNEEIVEAIDREETVETDGYATVGMKHYTYAEIDKNMAERDIISTYDYTTISLYNPDDKSTEKDFEDLTYSILTNVANLEYLEDVQVGLPCLSMFAEDSQWYRAKILRTDAKSVGYVTVIYVDYGNFEIVKISNLKNIRSEWLQFPARYIEATIDYILIKTEQEDVLKSHIQSLTGESKYIRVIQNKPLRVHIYNKKNDIFELHYDAFMRNGIVKI